ncbi:MAG: TonB family protein [Rariglobus sp.]|nr:TonB family protein [Rariglobus sp.]
MTAATSRPLVFSMLLHAGVLGGALLLMLRVGREQVVAEQPFVIFSAPVQSQTQQSTQSATSSVSVKLPAVVVPVPQPPARVVDERVNEPVRVVPSRPTAPPVVRTSPRTTVAEFRRQQSSTVKPVVTAGSTAVPTRAQINMDEVLSDAGQGNTKSAVTTDPAQEANYWGMLQAKLRDAHEKPAGLDDGLVVRMEFVLRADGTLGDVRVISSSGNAVFDASVVAAFRRVRGLGAPPSSKVGLNQVTFRTQAE